MGHPLRDRGTPRALGEARQTFDFTSSLSDFERLLGIVAADLGILDPQDRPENWRNTTIAGRLSFGFADMRETVPAVTGRASANIDAVCQRCLEPFELPLSVTLKYVLLPSGQQTDGFEGFEAWEMTANGLLPLDLVEETLIMALPLSAAHATLAECGPLASQIDKPPDAGSEKTRPFADLKAQLKDRI
jgi:uncharacterized protein